MFGGTMVRSQFARAVVTGGAGFLGSHLCEALLSSGTQVECLDNLLTGSASNVSHLMGDPAFAFTRSDVSDGMHVTGPVDLVLHFASPASPKDYMSFPIETMRAGSIGTMHALDLARSKGARFVLASTSEAYGDPLIHPQPETYWGNVNPVGPRCMYDEAKRFAEAITHVYRTTHGLDTAILRLFNSYGPRMRPDDGRVVATFIQQALAGEPLTVTGDGGQTRSLCFVDDLVRGILAVAASDLCGPVNIGSTEEMSVFAIASRIIELTGSTSSIEFTPSRPEDPRTRCPDVSLVESALGWRARIGLDAGIERTVDWFAESLAA